MDISSQALRFSGVVLAGGHSARMGKEKALIEVEGQPLWRRQYELLHQAGARDVWVSLRVDQNWLPVEINRIDDVIEDRGPMAGLGTVLNQTVATHVIVVATDLP